MLDLRIDAAAAAVDGDIRPAAVGVRDGVIVSLAPSEPAAEVVALGPDEVLLPGPRWPSCGLTHTPTADWPGSRPSEPREKQNPHRNRGPR